MTRVVVVGAGLAGLVAGVRLAQLGAQVSVVSKGSGGLRLSTGTVDVKPNTPAGTYVFDYTICEKANTSNCASATVTVTVGAAPIVATPDTYAGINGASGTTTASVIVNDTLNGVVLGRSRFRSSLYGNRRERVPI